ncbi:MAG: RNA polymerase sigma-70 factor [Pedobacter sp.]|nr:RNA polymerase sigma-70 factor [Pedobacter sp.]MDQ8053026.1 RNA polymerase sigma-70 factor [Pedobacter sp.]
MSIKTGKDLFHLVNESQLPAFTDFYTQFFQKLLLASDKHVKDIFVAEEIVQDIFLKIWENPHDLIEVKSLKAYLYRAVVNASINYVNRQKNIALHHQKIADEHTEEELEQMDSENELIVLLYEEINKLPAQCQRVFKMNRFEHLKYKEIAQQLHISERTVENHISTALKQLRNAFANKKVGKNQQKNRDLLFSLFLY